MARKAIYKHATQVNTGTYPDDGTSPVGSNEWNEAPDPQGMYGNTPATSTIAIATGVATPTDSVTVVAAETGTTDTLDKLAITNTNEYDLIYLFADTGDTITLTHTASPTADGQVVTVGSANETLSTTKPTILIRKGNYWYGYGGGTVADGSITTVKLAADAVTGAKIADDTVDSEHYVAGSIDLEHMSSQSVDEDNLHISNAPTNGYALTAQSANAGGLTWAAMGGDHTEQGWDIYTTHTGTATTSDGTAYMFARKIDSNNDGLYIMLWKNGASTEVQIA